MCIKALSFKNTCFQNVIKTTPVLDGLLPEAQVIPAYVSIKIALAESLGGKPPEEFDKLRERFAMESVDFKNHIANGNLGNYPWSIYLNGKHFYSR